jgi:signal transduction histidine kinase/CheY-like chemotaxis protein/predicted negative regulator of RcsB-dependent stress response
MRILIKAYTYKPIILQFLLWLIVLFPISLKASIDINNANTCDSIYKKIFSNPNEVKRLLNDLKKFEKNTPDSILLRHAKIIGVYYGVTNSNDSAFKYLTIALKYTNDGTIQRASALKHVAIIQRKVGQYSAALFILKEAQLIADSIGNIDLLAEIYAEIAGCNNFLYNNIEAIKYLEKAINILSKDPKKHEWDLAVNKLNLAMTFIENKNYNFARKILEELLIVFNKLGDKPNYLQALMQYGICLIEQGELKEAEVRLNQVIMGQIDFNDETIISIAKQALAKIYINTNRLAKANKLYEEIYRNSFKNKLPETISLSIDYLNYLNKVNRHVEVVNIENSCRPLLKSANIKDLVEYYKQIFVAHYHLGNDNEGDKFLKLFENLSDSLKKTDHLQIFTKTQAIYQNKIQENEIKLLEQERLTLQENMHKKSLFAIVLFLIIVGIGLSFYLKYKFVKKSNELNEIALKSELIDKQRLLLENEKQRLDNKLQDELMNRQNLALEVKANFVRNISHEIRTPLNAIKGIGEILSDDSTLTDYQKHHIALLKQSSHHLIQLVNTVFDYADLQSGVDTLSEEYIELDTLLKELSDVFLPMINKKGLQFHFNCNFGKGKLYRTDNIKLKQLLTNLLANAIKFTEAGSIELNAFEYHSNGNIYRIHFEVKDTGCGIPVEKQKQIFVAFEQADLSNTKRIQGLGLGLTIANIVARRLNSNIGLISEPFLGSTFYFDLLADTIVHNQIIYPDLYEEFSLDGKNILIVEDSTVNAMVIANVLKREKSEFSIAPNGQIALDLLKEQKFDLILMDLQMPVLDGINCCRIIRSNKEEYYQKLPIIALTAAKESELEKEAKSAGMNDYVIKPFERLHLISAMKKALIEVG